MALKFKGCVVELYSFVNVDRSARVRWLLEELEVSYVDRTLDYDKGESKTPEYLALNPMGRVPTLVDGPVIISESAAICMYLADKFALKGLAPRTDSPERPAYLQWMAFSIGTLEPLFTDLHYREHMKEGQKFEIDRTTDKIVRTLEIALEGRNFIIGDHFSAADIMITDLLRWKKMLLLEKSPVLKAYYDRMTKRPARIRSMAEKNQSPS